MQTQASKQSTEPPNFQYTHTNLDDNASDISTASGSDSSAARYDSDDTSDICDCTYRSAAEGRRYDILEELLPSTKPSTSTNGTTSFPCLSSWDSANVAILGGRLVDVGADVDALAKEGATIALTWSVQKDNRPHTSVLLELGADPLSATEDGDNALSLAARLHLTDHLRLLMENIRPARLRKHLGRLVEAAAGGESRSAHMSRHGQRWNLVACETLQLLEAWNALFNPREDFTALLVPALENSLKSPYALMNTDVQMSFITRTAVSPTRLDGLLKESVLTGNEALFEALLDYGVAITYLTEDKQSLLHLCGSIPNDTLASTAVALRLLKLGADIEAKDKKGITPWMNAVLKCNWSLADLLLREGAIFLATDNEGFNVLGLSIKAINLESTTYLVKHCARKTSFRQGSFLVNQSKRISALQLAAAIPPSHENCMEREVNGIFLTILTSFGHNTEQLHFRSDGLLPNATALDIAASRENIFAVQSLCERGARLVSDQSVYTRAAKIEQELSDDLVLRKDVENRTFIIEKWDKRTEHARRLAEDWTNTRAIDGKDDGSSWELVESD